MSEFNSNLVFSYDGLYIEAAIYYRKSCIGFLPVLGVPLVSEEGGRYYAHWEEEKPKFTEPFNSIEELMKHYLPTQLASWIKKVPPDTFLYIYMTTCLSMVKIVNSSCPPNSAHKPFLRSILKLWNP